MLSYWPMGRVWSGRGQIRDVDPRCAAARGRDMTWQNSIPLPPIPTETLEEWRAPFSPGPDAPRRSQLPHTYLSSSSVVYVTRRFPVDVRARQVASEVIAWAGRSLRLWVALVHGPMRQGPRVHRSIRSVGCPRGLGPSVGLRRVRGGSWGGGVLFRPSSVDRRLPPASGSRMASGVVVSVSKLPIARPLLKGPLGQVQGN